MYFLWMDLPDRKFSTSRTHCGVTREVVVRFTPKYD